MKLDILKNSWVDIVFEGRNKLYGAYDLRKSSGKTSTKALIIGAIFFSLAVSAPLIISLIPKSEEDDTLDKVVVLTNVKLPPKKVEPPKLNAPPPPPPPDRKSVV